MGTRVVVASVLALLLNGCAGVSDKMPLVQLDPSTPKDDACETSGARAPIIKHVTINFQPDPMKVVPDSICARPGDVLWFKFNGNPHADLKVESKTGDVVWLRNEGKQKWFYVLIPWDLEAKDERRFEYKVILGNNEKVLDPEVRVKHNYD